MEPQTWVFLPLILATVEGIKRHVPSIVGWKTVLLAAVVCVALVAGDRFLPAEYNIVRQLFALFALAIGGNAYLSQLASKLGVTFTSTSSGFDVTETPTKPEMKTIPPKGAPQ